MSAGARAGCQRLGAAHMLAPSRFAAVNELTPMAAQVQSPDTRSNMMCMPSAEVAANTDPGANGVAWSVPAHPRSFPDC